MRTNSESELDTMSIDIDAKNEVNKQQKSKWTVLFNGFKLLFFILSTVFLFMVLFLIDKQGESEYYFSYKVKTDIEKVIKQGGDIESVKHIFNSKILQQKKLINFFNSNEQKKYSENTSLLQILNDIKVDLFLNEKNTVDTLLLESVNLIISTHNQTNPFEKLEENQKVSFENVRTKLGDKYELVQEDINRITDELDSKNMLVTQYLDNSSLSLNLSMYGLACSIIGLVLSIILNLNSLFKNNENSKKTESEFRRESRSDKELGLE